MRMKTLLNYDAVKTTHRGTDPYFKDTPDHIDGFKNDAGLTKRKALWENSKIDLIWHIHSIFNWKNLLINSVELRMKLVRWRDGFSIVDWRGVCGSKITDATLIVSHVKISSGILIAHTNAWTKTTVKYPITRVARRNFVLHSGTQEKFIDNVVLGQLPKTIILGFVSTLATTIPDLPTRSILVLYVHGVQVSSNALKLNYTSGKYVECYQTLFFALMHFLNQGIFIKRTDNPNAYCLYAFDLTPELSEILFDPLDCIIYAEYDNVLKIDQSHHVTMDTFSEKREKLVKFTKTPLWQLVWELRMDLMVNIRCCVNAENVHIPWEIAVLSLTDEYIGHRVMAPP